MSYFNIVAQSSESTVVTEYKPQAYEEMAVPEVLYSGNHKLIHLAQYRNALELTQARRPDLFRRYIEKVEKEKTLTKEERKILEEIVRKTTGS